MSSNFRKTFDKIFTTISYLSLFVMCLVVLFFLLPIIAGGASAVFFLSTIEHDKFQIEVLNKPPSSSFYERLKVCDSYRGALYEMINAFENSNQEALKNIENNFAAERALAEKNFILQSDKFQEALKETDSSKRSEILREISAEGFKNYLSLLADFSKDGSPAALAILSKEEDAIAKLAKNAIDGLQEKIPLSLIQKSAIRRALSTNCKDEISKIKEKIEEKNLVYTNLKKGIHELLGPENLDKKNAEKLMRKRFGQTRMNLAKDVFEKEILNLGAVSTDANGNKIQLRVSALEYFKGTKVEEIIKYLEANFNNMLSPRYTFYFGFFTDNPYDANIFGGIFPMILGTIYLTAGAMLIASPLGIIAAIYFCEYAKPGRIISILQMCVGTLAGVPSIVFGLFGLTFIINTLKISEGKSVLAGAITLAILILPTIIRSCEEAIKAVPKSYKEAALGLGAGKWRAIIGVILPAALPSMLTGIIISMGRAAGETAPIIFTAATSTGAALAVWEIFSQPTPALPWNIYNMASEHEMADRVAHVQYGMVLTLLVIVLSLNFIAILLRTKLKRNLKH